MSVLMCVHMRGGADGHKCMDVFKGVCMGAWMHVQESIRVCTCMYKRVGAQTHVCPVYQCVCHKPLLRIPHSGPCPTPRSPFVFSEPT